MPVTIISQRKSLCEDELFAQEAVSLRKLLFCLIGIVSFICQAAPGEPMPKSLGLGGASVSSAGVDAVFSNPAGLDGRTLFLGSQNYSWNLVGSSFAFVEKGWGLGSRVLAAADAMSGGMDFIFWAGKEVTVGENISAGLAFSGFSSAGPSISGRGASLDGGAIWRKGQGKVGLLWRNLAAIESWESYQGKSSHQPQCQVALGLAWEGEKFGAAADLWPEGENLKWQAGVCFSVSAFQLRLGYDDLVPSVGIAFDVGQRSIEYSWRGGQYPMSYLGLKFD
jgi:hypothetical protein